MQAVEDAVLATSERQARDLWTLREGLAIDALPQLVNFDVSLPTGELGAFAERCEAALRARWPDVTCLFFGHVGDGNVHIGVSLAGMTDTDLDALDHCVYAVVRDMGGSVSAEHGIGVLKRLSRAYAKRRGNRIDATPEGRAGSARHPESRQGALIGVTHVAGGSRPA